MAVTRVSPFDTKVIMTISSISLVSSRYTTVNICSDSIVSSAAYANAFSGVSCQPSPTYKYPSSNKLHELKHKIDIIKATVRIIFFILYPPMVFNMLTITAVK